MTIFSLIHIINVRWLHIDHTETILDDRHGYILSAEYIRHRRDTERGMFISTYCVYYVYCTEWSFWRAPDDRGTPCDLSVRVLYEYNDKSSKCYWSLYTTVDHWWSTLLFFSNEKLVEMSKFINVIIMCVIMCTTVYTIRRCREHIILFVRLLLSLHVIVCINIILHNPLLFFFLSLPEELRWTRAYKAFLKKLTHRSLPCSYKYNIYLCIPTI